MLLADVTVAAAEAVFRAWDEFLMESLPRSL